MAYETPKNADTETFVEMTASTQIHSGAVPTKWSQLTVAKNCDRGGELFSDLKGPISISTDGATTLCTISSDVYIPLSFPVYVQSVGKGSTCNITLINYTMGGATVKE